MPRQQLAIVLARSPEPLLAKEVREGMAMHFADDLVPSLGEVRTLLAEGSEFVQVGRSRWQLGREVGPWEGEYQLS